MNKAHVAFTGLVFISISDLALWALRQKYYEIEKTLIYGNIVSSLVVGTAWYLVALWGLLSPIWATAFAATWLGITCWHIIEIMDKK